MTLTSQKARSIVRASYLGRTFIEQEGEMFIKEGQDAVDPTGAVTMCTTLKKKQTP